MTPRHHGSHNESFFTKTTARVLKWMGTPPRVTWLSYLPPFTPFEKAVPPLEPWPTPDFEVPAELQGVVGVGRNPEHENQAFEDGPVGQWTIKYEADNNLLMANIWRSVLPTAPRFIRGQRAIVKAAAVKPATPPRPASPEELTRQLKELSASLGISAIGVAEMDRRYIVAEHQDREFGDKMIVCIAERNWEAVQTGPSAAFEQASLHANGELMQRVAQLSAFLKSYGYKTEALPFEAVALSIPFAVAAGLGQLGINGQLLTPQAGSRSSLCLISTEAPLIVDGPRDFGIEALCDKCLVCVRRCPTKAIPAKRVESRGVVKAKLRLDRCIPAVAKVHGCGICMTTCPAQKFGTAAMIEHWEKTGEILGKDTEDLEGYVWEDGKYYGLRERPSPDPVFMAMPSFPIKHDPTPEAQAASGVGH